MKLSIRTLLLIGIIAEVAIFLSCYLMHPELEEVFRHSARYSGRLSLGVFLAAFYLFGTSYPQAVEDNQPLRNFLSLFAVLHLIHFGFLATNVYLNDIPLEAVKVAGGAFAYLMIVAAPFVLHRFKAGVQLVYFYYVSLVMALTYLARIKGDFEGAEPFWFHYLAMGAVIVACGYLGFRIFTSSKRLAA